MSMINLNLSAAKDYLSTREGCGKVATLVYRVAENLGSLFEEKVFARVGCEFKNVAIILNMANLVSEAHRISTGKGYFRVRKGASSIERKLTYLAQISEMLANAGLPFLFLRNREIYHMKGPLGALIDGINQYALLVFNLSTAAISLCNEARKGEWVLPALKAVSIFIQQLAPRSVAATGIGLIVAIMDLKSKSGAGWSSVGCCC